MTSNDGMGVRAREYAAAAETELGSPRHLQRESLKPYRIIRTTSKLDRHRYGTSLDGQKRLGFPARFSRTKLHRFNLCDSVPSKLRQPGWNYLLDQYPGNEDSEPTRYKRRPLDTDTRTCLVEPHTVTLSISVRPSQEERLQIAIARIHQEQDDTLAAQLLINETLREYKEYKLEQKLRMSASTTTASTNPNTSAGAPNNHSAVDHIGNPEDTSILATRPCRTAPSSGAPLPLEDRVRQLSMLQIKKKTAETTDSQITNASQNKTRDEAMDLDDPSTFSEDTPKRPNSPDIVALSKKERIRLLIKEHIAIWKKFELEKLSGATPELKTILHQAQDSQKALQKLITKEELKGYVKGWNPWDAKRELFPPPPKKEGKKKSSTSRKAQQYNDPRVWADVFEIGQAWRAAYKQRSRKALPP
ncbi:hypothetical protein PGT21_018981 [Puccinia graminis f. sp. tritici]|uniref:Uncharacterized protein n=1 Tax=Puccinia graminis f. sp. tritici TaxID=56615 RepID=A0A5B0MCB8_PUCGR|nr:hypothetical protein PGT21_018981 [Puccinia graminis f. sp. tritici]